MNETVVVAIISGMITLATTIITLLTRLRCCKKKSDNEQHYEIIEIEFIDIESSDDEIA